MTGSRQTRTDPVLKRGDRPVIEPLEARLHPWSSLAIVPLFALANAGVYLGGDSIERATSSPIAWGIVLGLVVGKPLGYSQPQSCADCEHPGDSLPREDRVFLVARSGMAFGMQRILVAVDGSEGSRRAAQFTNEFFIPLGVEVLVMNVSPTPMPWFPGVGNGLIGPYACQPMVRGMPGEAIPVLMREAREQAELVVAESGIEDDGTIAEVGDPVEVIRETADAEDVDLVVVGPTDKGWWRRLLEGSVSDQLLHHGDRPVLLVR